MKKNSMERNKNAQIGKKPMKQTITIRINEHENDWLDFVTKTNEVTLTSEKAKFLRFLINESYRNSDKIQKFFLFKKKTNRSI